ncbi:hypothetical protein MBGDC06_00288 [Thermoplasmatales archaeon SCGC AB-539-C06]|nr:hypothetical protein MBGDC06_00288 [Thermoplasmatales archaeon SCGC AB-539-C06]
MPKLQIDLNDFPDDIYILLEDEFRANFFKTAWRINKSYRHLAKKLGVSNTTMLSWRRRKSKKHDHYCSMWAIRKIINFSKHSLEWKFNLEIIQKNIKSIRAKAGAHKIYDIKLPIEGQQS